MKYRQLGNTGIRVSSIGAGTWAMGGGSIWADPVDESSAVRTLQASLDAGVNFIDTAPAYGWGRAEEIVGRAIRNRREQTILATKCGLWWKDQRGSFFQPYDGRDLYRSLRPDTIRIEVEDSLRRLGTDWIDLYQTHWQTIEPDKTPIDDTMACLESLKQEGKIRAIGVSNVSKEELQDYLGIGGIVGCQQRYNILCRRRIETDILPICRSENVSVIAYSTLEQGLLTGAVRADREFPAGDIRGNPAWNPWMQPANRSRVLEVLDGWSEIIERHNCTLAQLAIAWIVHQAGVATALCCATTPDQAAENAAAAEIQLTDEDMATMRRDVKALGKPL